MSRKLDTVTASTVSTPTVSVPLDTNKNQSLKQDLHLRISKGKAIEKKGTGLQPSETPSTDQGQSIQQPITPYRSGTRMRGSNSFTSIGQALAKTRPALLMQPRPISATDHPAFRIPISDQLAACIEDIAQEVGDLRHRRSNLTQAVHLQEQTALPESVFATKLYEARAITKDRLQGSSIPGFHRVAKPMAYFWTVVRDQLGLTIGQIEAAALPNASEDPTRQGRGERWTNRRVGVEAHGTARPTQSRTYVQQPSGDPRYNLQ
jgi:hypothetical protein